ncbi:MAG: ComEC/Rec2 family competence protein [Crocosphaera sp.]|nr:ComEC/Rec2 family competence protein [Crocosphaera sp.]
MRRFHYLILIFGYISGLLLTGLWGVLNFQPSWEQWLIVCGLGSLLPIGVFLWLRSRWLRCPKISFWLLVSFVTLSAIFYLQWRIPVPNSTDVSQFFLDGFRTQKVELLGKLLSEPRLTNNNRKRFWLQAQKVKFLNQNKNQFQSVTGKIYVTLAIEQAVQIYPSQTIIIRGNLYQPQSPKNPGSFDFKKYLLKQGSFAGIKGEEIIFKGEMKRWGLTQVRQRIIDGFTNALGEKNGLIISSMILGRRAVDLPPDIRDLFVTIGLSHVLSASGFHVALLLGIIFWLTQSLSSVKKLIIGCIILIFYIGLTGIQPSILRASFMGFTILLAEVLNRKTNPLSALLLSGFILLVINPLWIWELGFQLSFLSTFALLVTGAAIEDKLDFLPRKIASIIAVPVAVSIWTSPLIMYLFYTFSFYIIPFNILTTPLIMLLVIGGMISAILILINPILGGFIAQFLFWPSQILLQSGQQISNLKLTAFAVGKISLFILIIIYATLLTLWLNKNLRKYWKLGGILIVALIAMPIIYNNLTLFKITILQTNNEPIMVIQDRGNVEIINVGNPSEIEYILLPFLSQQGINKVDKIIVRHSEEIKPWSNLKSKITTETILTIFDNQEHKLSKNTTEIILNSMSIKLINRYPLVLQYKIKEQSFLWISNQTQNNQPPSLKIDVPLNLLIWSGKQLSIDWLKWLETVKAKTVIISTNFIPTFIQKELINKNIQWHWMQEEGAVEWTVKKGIKPFLKSTQQNP